MLKTKLRGFRTTWQANTNRWAIKSYRCISEFNPSEQLFIPTYRARISTPAGVSQTGPSFLQGSVAGLSKDLAKNDVVEHKLQTLFNQEMAATKDIPHNVGCGCKVGYVISSLSQ